jgi:hypothetical protein
MRTDTARRLPGRSQLIMRYYEIACPDTGRWHVRSMHVCDFDPESQMSCGLAFWQLPNGPHVFCPEQSRAGNTHLFTPRSQVPGFAHRFGGVWQSLSPEHATAGASSGTAASIGASSLPASIIETGASGIAGWQ